MKVCCINKIAAAGMAPMLLLAAGCIATRDFVRNHQAPLEAQTAGIDQRTTQNAQDIKELDRKTEAGISDAQRAAEQARNAIDNPGSYRVIQRTTITFGLNKCELTLNDMLDLSEVAHALTSVKQYVVQIKGYADETGPAQYNLDLSQRRAEAVVRYLTLQRNVPLTQIHSFGYGASSPVASNDTQEGRAANRRVEITVLVPQFTAQTAETGQASPARGNH